MLTSSSRRAARGTPAIARASALAAQAPTPTAYHARLASTGGVPPGTAASVVHIATNLRATADVEDLVLTYGVPNAHIPSRVRPLAVVKVGGEVIAKDIDNLVASLRFMREFGLLPVVIHGGGPQLNDELAKAGVQPQYIGGECAKMGCPLSSCTLRDCALARHCACVDTHTRGV